MVGLAVRLKKKQVVVADANGTISCIAVKVSKLKLQFSYIARMNWLLFILS